MRTMIRFSSRFEDGGEDGRQRDHQARKLGLANNALLIDDRGHRVARRFLEERVEHDPQQQHHGVVFDFAVADFEDQGEDEEQDPEHDQRPQVTEHGTE